MSHFRKSFVKQITHTNEIDSNIWLFDLPTWFFDLFLFIIIFIFSKFIIFFSQKFPYVR
jgi:hypothetical protein